MKTKTLLAVACLSLVPTLARAAGPVNIIKVVVSCRGEDSIGQRLCFAVKEKIRGSHGFELVEEAQAEASNQGFGVHLISEDPANPNSPLTGSTSAVAIVFTVPRKQQIDGFVTAGIIMCGAKNVDEAASGILARIETSSAPLRKLPSN